MPRLILKSDVRVLQECTVGPMATIGRLADNVIVVDDPAVSGHHACVFRENDSFILEDLESTNGTFVNDKRVSRHALENGDVIRIGKQKLVFDTTAREQPETRSDAERIISNPDDTVFLDAGKHKALLAMLKEAGMAAETDAAQSPARVGVLRVLAGGDESEYTLEARTSVVGKSPAALVRLRGWFKPKVAVAIARGGDGYVATLVAGKTLINSRPAEGRYTLKDGDVLEVSGLRLEFRLRESAAA